MGRIIRRTVTITITETWTIVWTEEGRAEDKPPAPATTIIPEQPKPQEEANETMLPAVTTGAATDAPPDEVAAKAKTLKPKTSKSEPGRQRKPTRRHRAAGNP